MAFHDRRVKEVQFTTQRGIRLSVPGRDEFTCPIAAFLFGVHDPPSSAPQVASGE